jgi:TonB family protein
MKILITIVWLVFIFPLQEKIYAFSSNDVDAIDSLTLDEHMKSQGAEEKIYDCKPVIKIEPRYPTSAYELGEEATVNLNFRVDNNMFAESIEVLDQKNSSLFEIQAINSLKKWMFNKKDIGKLCTIKIEFRLEQ